MDVREVGRIQAYNSKPYLYIIVKANYLYIGQTQSNPVIRWGDHLQKTGTFFTSLSEHDKEVAEDDDIEITFYAFSCNEIKDSSSSIFLKRETEYAETLLHIRFFESEIAPNYIVISNHENVHDCRNSEIQEKIILEIMEKFKDEVYSKTIKIGNNLNIFNL